MLLNQEYEVHGIVEQYDSIIWTERFTKAGDFEVFLALSPEAIAAYQKDYYLWSSESEHVMIVEDLEIESKEEAPTMLKVTGRSLESILERRIVWGMLTLGGNLQAAIKQLITSQIITATDPTRHIPGLVFEDSTDPAVTSLEIEAVQLIGENIYEVITSMTELFQIGFKITLTDSNQLVFKLYAGKDRSYDQVMNPRVIFSPSFDNLGSSKYLNSNRIYKETALIGGEGEGVDKKFFWVSRGGTPASGLARREIFVDSSVTSNIDPPVSPAEYADIMRMEGSRALLEHDVVTAFDGEILSTNSFEYMKDFAMGDIVQLEDIYVPEANSKSRVVEFIRSDDTGGKKAYPTLQSV